MKKLTILLTTLFTLVGILTVRAEEFEPDFESVCFVPKGQWITGVSVSYSQSTQNNYQFLVLEDITGDTYSLKVSPMLLFTFKNDLAAGGKFGYNRSLTKLENADIVFDPETNYNVDHLYRLAHNYYGMAVMRNYFSLGKSKRFGIFTETQFEVGGGQAKIMTGLGEDLSGSYEKSFNVGIGLAPGMAVFLNNFTALEVNVGVLGFEYNHITTLTDQIYDAHIKTKSAIFRINLFSINFGVAFYL
ncbi:MAG: hypothetical protein NC095_01090 [Muribaculum sp.]|nr:hypothetical protein [Muribaculum sp.]